MGLALNVDSLVTGRVMQQGSLLNIQAELVDVATETQVWGDQYRHPVSELIPLQEQIAWQISEALRIRLSAPEKKRLRKRATGSGEAYQEYLRGRHEWSKWRAEGFRKAIGHFEAAISIDPKYARAYAGLAETYGALGYYGHLADRRRDDARLGRRLRRTRSRPGLAEAHAAMGICRMFHSWDWIGAEHALRKGLELEPRNPTIHMYIGLLHTALGRHEEALASHAARPRARSAVRADADERGVGALLCAPVPRGARCHPRGDAARSRLSERAGVPGHHLRAAGPARARGRIARPRERCSSPRGCGKTR